MLGKILNLIAPNAPAPVGAEGDHLNDFDVAFIVDTTGSMGAFIDAARQHMVAMLERLTSATATLVNLRTALVEYRDHPPQELSFVTREYGFTSKLTEMQKTIAKLTPSGGGDEPEAVLDGLLSACSKLAWRPHSRRVAILIGDARPHGWSAHDEAPHNACGETVNTVTAAFEEQLIVLYSLGLTPSVDMPFTWLARATGGTYFAAHRGQDAMSALESVLSREFADLDFDRRVREQYLNDPTAMLDDRAVVLECPPARVAASLSRLGRRGLLSLKSPAPALQ